MVLSETAKSGWIAAGANIMIDFLAAGALRPVLLGVEILLAGRNSHLACQCDHSPVHVNLDSKSL